MDTSGFSQVGRYGTLSLLKKHNAGVGNAEASQVVTSFGIDNSNLTFGRASTCDVRLYYPSVDPVHCTLVNEEGKAFLAVRGKSGAFVDGCWVYPHSASSSTSSEIAEESQQSIIPLSNDSEFEIHGKRFRFTYPPKEVRKVLLSTPVAQRSRKLRLSMIQSAQVFSPRPSHDPRENLRVLQTPIKASIFGGGGAAAASERSRSQSPTKPRAVSPLKFGIRAPSESDSDEEEDDFDEGQDENENARGRKGYSDGGDEDHIVLVHTNHPRVVEEERDLVILEDVPLHLILPSPSVYSSSPVRGGSQQPGLAQPQPQPPTTPPRRRSIGGNALHRAVLIRSAQRAVWKAEKEREEQEEEMEVLEAVVDPAEAGDVSDEDEDEDFEDDDFVRGRPLAPSREEPAQELEDVEMRSASDEDEQESTEEEDEEEQRKAQQQKPLWRKSIERIIPWGFGGKKEDGHENEEDAEEENDKPAPLPVRPLQHERVNATPARRTLGPFMTPQPPQFSKTSGAAADAAADCRPGRAPAAGPGRLSLGGGEPRRVLIQQPWKVKDLDVPLVSDPTSDLRPTPGPALRAMDPPSAMTAASLAAAAAAAGSATLPTVPGSAKKPPVSEEERRAIQERRRSAAQELKAREDAFWKDGAPGMLSSPVKSPAKAATGLGVGRPSFMTAGMTPSSRPLFGSPTKGTSLGYAIKESEAEQGDAEGDKLFLDDAARSDKARAAGTPRKSSGAAPKDDDDESLDTEGLLERMKQTVESMKQQRRRSSAAHRVPPTPKALFGDGGSSSSSSSSSIDSTPTVTPVRATLGSVKKIDFTKINTPGSLFSKPPVAAAPAAPAKTIPGTPVPVTPPKADAPVADDDAIGNDDDLVTEPKDLEPFSLLRPGVSQPLLTDQETEEETRDTEADDEADHPQPVPILVVEPADEEGSDEPEPEPKKAKSRGPRLLRAPKATAQAEDSNEQEIEGPAKSQQVPPKPNSSSKKPSSRSKPPSSSAKPRSRSAARSPGPEPAPPAQVAPPESGTKRRQRSKTPQPRPEPQEMEEELEQPPTRATARRTRKGTVEPEEPGVAVTPAPTTAKKRGRKAAAEREPETVEEAEEEDVSEDKPAPVKRGRKPRSAAPTEEVEVAPTPAVVKRSRSRKAKEPEQAASAVAAEEDDEGDDELDSYQVSPDTAPTVKTPGAGRSTSKKPEKERAPSQIRPPSRTQQLKEKKTVGTAKVKKEPDADESADLEQKAPATTRGRTGAVKTPASRSATTKAATGRTTITTGSKTRGKTAKTPGSSQTAAPTAPSPTDDSEEKENTPGPSGNGSDESKEEPVTKVRVSRRAGAAAAGKSATTGRAKTATKTTAVKEEEDDGPVTNAATTGRTRATRVMRTRTKTG